MPQLAAYNRFISTRNTFASLVFPTQVAIMEQRAYGNGRGPLAQSVEQLTSFGVTIGKLMAEKVSKSGNPSASRRRQSRAKPQEWGRCRGLMAPAYVSATGYGEGKVQTTNPASGGGESRSGRLISRSLVRIQQGSPPTMTM